VEIHVTDDTIGRYFRRYQLALRISHGARTQTVCDWSGLTRDQLVTLRRRWGFDPEERRRGPAPTAFYVFFKTRRHSSEAALFASLCRMVGATTDRLGEEAAERLPSLENGELLCEAVEAYREWQPDAKLEFEHAVLLAGGVVHGKVVALGHCSDCRGAVLIDRMGSPRTGCGLCDRSARQESNGGVIDHYEHAESQREADHVPEWEVRSGSGSLESDRNEKTEKEEPAADELDDGGEEHQNSEKR
jgi:hypothetical protein